MLEKHALSDLTIIQYLKKQYHIEVSHLTFLPIGADMHACLYKAQTADQQRYFLKLKQGTHDDISVAIVELLQQVAVEEIIPPLKTVQGRATQSLDEFTLIVYPFIEGQNGFDHNLTKEQWIKLGKALRQIHEVAMPPSLQKRIRQESYSSKWRDALRSIYPSIERKLLTDEIGLNLQKFMRNHLADICRLVERSEVLGKQLQEESLAFVLCHSDIHAGNVLIHENSAIYIVDWDEPIMAPKERDLMFIGGGVGNVWNKLSETKLFYQGYGETEINPIALSYYRHERIVEDIAIYAKELLLTKEGGKNRLEMYQHFLAMFEPHGVVDIAFKTDKNLSI